MRITNNKYHYHYYYYYNYYYCVLQNATKQQFQMDSFCFLRPFAGLKLFFHPF